MHTLSLQIDDLHEAEKHSMEADEHLQEWRAAVRALQRDLESGACTDEHWKLSLRRAKARCNLAELDYKKAAENLARLRMAVAVAETLDINFDETERVYIGPFPTPS